MKSLLSGKALFHQQVKLCRSYCLMPWSNYVIVCASHSTVITFSESSSRKRSFPDSDNEESEELQARRGLWFKPYRQGGELSGEEESYDGASESEDAHLSGELWSAEEFSDMENDSDDEDDEVAKRLHRASRCARRLFQCEPGYEGDQESEEEDEETSCDEEAPRRRNGRERFSSLQSRLSIYSVARHVL